MQSWINTKTVPGNQITIFLKSTTKKVNDCIKQHKYLNALNKSKHKTYVSMKPNDTSFRLEFRL